MATKRPKDAPTEPAQETPEADSVEFSEATLDTIERVRELRRKRKISVKRFKMMREEMKKHRGDIDAYDDQIEAEIGTMPRAMRKHTRRKFKAAKPWE